MVTVVTSTTKKRGVVLTFLSELLYNPKNLCKFAAMEQIERIKQMELRLERAATAVMELSAALDKYAAIREDIKSLSDYYGSEQWKQDFADDEAGLLPNYLKRGVLSEDGIWNLLSDAKELDERLSKTNQL